MGQKFSQKGSNAKETRQWKEEERSHPRVIRVKRRTFSTSLEVGEGKERVNPGYTIIQRLEKLV